MKTQQTQIEEYNIRPSKPTPAQASGNCQTSHSPLPWQIINGAVFDADAHMVYYASEPANAAFIVRACNNAQRLTDELERCRDLLIAYRLAFTSSFSPDSDDAIKSSYQALQDAGVPNAQKFDSKLLKVGE